MELGTGTRASQKYFVFSFEMDTLEIVLKEHVDVVDKIFMGEIQISMKSK